MFYLYFLPVLCTFPAKQVSSLYAPCRYQRHTNKLYQDTEASCISLNNTYKQNVDFRLISKYFCCTRYMNHLLQYRNQYISAANKAPNHLNLHITTTIHSPYISLTAIQYLRSTLLQCLSTKQQSLAN